MTGLWTETIRYYISAWINISNGQYTFETLLMVIDINRGKIMETLSFHFFFLASSSFSSFFHLPFYHPIIFLDPLFGSSFNNIRFIWCFTFQTCNCLLWIHSLTLMKVIRYNSFNDDDDEKTVKLVQLNGNNDIKTIKWRRQID